MVDSSCNRWAKGWGETLHRNERDG